MQLHVSWRFWRIFVCSTQRGPLPAPQTAVISWSLDEKRELLQKPGVYHKLFNAQALSGVDEKVCIFVKMTKALTNPPACATSCFSRPKAYLLLGFNMTKTMGSEFVNISWGLKR
jgi:hypothetical protein